MALSFSVTEQSLPEQRNRPEPPANVPANSRPSSAPVPCDVWVIEPPGGAAASEVERVTGHQASWMSSSDAGTVSPLSPLTSFNRLRFSGVKAITSGAPTSA